MTMIKVTTTRTTRVTTRITTTTKTLASTAFNLDGRNFFWEFLGRYLSDDNDKSDNNNNDNNDNNKDTSFHSFQLRWLKFFWGVPGKVPK